MTQRLLYLTESTFDFSHVDPSSKLISQYKENLPPGVYHTSLGDLSADQIIQLSSQFDVIKLEPQGFDFDSDVYKESRILYRYLCRRELDSNLDITQFTTHPDINSRLPQPTLWVFGCSHSYGVGLKPGESNYGQLLSQQLNMPLKSITKPGSSLHWSYRHLFNAPIESQDIVIWQLTTPNRVSTFNGEFVQEIVLSSSKDRKLIDSITKEQLFFNQISLLNTGVRFLRLIGCKFLLISINQFESIYDYVSEYIKYPEYCPSYGVNIDKGTDGLHVGPLSHQAIAQSLLNSVQ
jgi:hypothetical protein